jgi:hypothetical protein
LRTRDKQVTLHTAMSRQSERRQSLIQRTTFDRLRWEYAALPGMRLTLAQVERMCGVNRFQCSAVLDALVKAGFLKLTIDGMYATGDRI